MDHKARHKKEREVFKDFKAFLLKQNALALAVAVIIGTAIGKVVTSIVEDVINPLLGRMLPGGD
jgi:large conductance mechanosensitive channel